MKENGKYKKVDKIRRGIEGRWKRWGEGKMLKGFMKVEKRWKDWGMDYGFED